MQRWPELPYAAWKDTAATLQLWTQIVGKMRLALTPWLNHSWHVTLSRDGARPRHAAHLRRRPRSPDRVRLHRSRAVAAHQRRPFRASSCLRPMPVAEFYADIACSAVRARCRRAHRRDAERDSRCHSLRPRTHVMPPTTATSRTASGACCSASHEVFSHFRTALPRQGEPGAFLLGQFRSRGDALLRARARRAHPGGVPHLPDAVAREAYSHEVSSAGFWPGGGADRLSRVLFLRLSRAGGLRRGARAAGAGVLQQGLSANSSCPMTPCAPRPIRNAR